MLWLTVLHTVFCFIVGDGFISVMQKRHFCSAHFLRNFEGLHHFQRDTRSKKCENPLEFTVYLNILVCSGSDFDT